MAVDARDPVTGSPIFLDGMAPDTAVDPTEVAKYAADVGNRINRADFAALDAYPYKRAGLLGHARDTKTDYLHDGSGWKLWHRLPTAYTPTLTNFSGSPTVAARYSIASGRVFVSMVITLAGANVGTAPEVSLPVAARALVGTAMLGRALYRKGPQWVLGEINPTTTTRVQLLAAILQGTVMNVSTNVNANTPFTWASGDSITLEFSYEAG